MNVTLVAVFRSSCLTGEVADSSNQENATSISSKMFEPTELANGTPSHTWKWTTYDDNNSSLLVKWITPTYNSSMEWRWTPNSTAALTSMSWMAPMYMNDSSWNPFNFSEVRTNSPKAFFGKIETPPLNWSFSPFNFDLGNLPKTPNFTMPDFFNGSSVLKWFSSNGMNSSSPVWNWTLPITKRLFNWTQPDDFSWNWTIPGYPLPCSLECITDNASFFPVKGTTGANRITLNWTASKNNSTPVHASTENVNDTP